MDVGAEDDAEFLARLYDPPLRRFPRRAGKPHPRARAAAWGAALKAWLAGYEQGETRANYRRAVSALWGYCRKLPWEVRQADVTGWLEVGLAGKTSLRKIVLLRWIRFFYRLACQKTWTTPAGRRLRLCPANPADGMKLPQQPWFPQTDPLSESEWERLQSAFDLETPFGRRDCAIFTLILETGLPLKQALKLRLSDIEPAGDSAQTIFGESQTSDGGLQRGFWPSQARLDPKPSVGGRSTAWQAVQFYLEAGGRRTHMSPDDYLFTPLKDVFGKLAKRHPLDWDRRPLSVDTACQALKAYAAWAGLDAERVTPEALRFTGARRLVQNGASTEDVAAFLRLKKLSRVRQIVERLKGAESKSQPKNPQEPSNLDSLTSVTPPSSPPGNLAGSLQRRRPGAQPGNRNSLKHGLHAYRYSLKRLGIHRNSIKNVDLANLPEILAELREMEWDVFGLPEEDESGSPSVDILIKKLRKLGHLAMVNARLRLLWARKRRGEEQ